MMGPDRLSRNVGKEFPSTIHGVISQKRVDMIAAESFLTSQKGLCFMELVNDLPSYRSELWCLYMDHKKFVRL